MEECCLLVGEVVLSRWIAGLVLLVAAGEPMGRVRGAEFTAAGELKFPARYREWVYVTSGLGMTYGSAGPNAHPMFDNVFVNPEAYRAFVETGAWPDGTELVLENRGSKAAASIDKAGRTQSEEVMGLEVHVKDAAHGGWGFYDVSEKGPAKRIAQTASCYSCHEAHAAVDTTFVQFYPTLLPVARAKGTLSAAYKKDIAGQ